MHFEPAISFRHPAIQKISLLLLPSIFGVGITQINLLVDSLMASFLSEGSVSYLYYADRVVELVLGIFVLSLATVTLPELSQQAAERKMEDMKRTILFTFRMVAFVAIPATVGMVVLAHPIVEVLFQHGRFSAADTAPTAVALAFYALELFSISSVRVVVPAFYALHDTKTPVRSAFLALLVNIVLNWVLMHPLKHGGIALATSIASTVNLVQLVFIFQKRYGQFQWSQFLETIKKVAIASTAMALVTFLSMSLLRFDSAGSLMVKAVILFVTIGAGLAVYLGVATRLGLEEIQSVKSLLAFRKRK